MNQKELDNIFTYHKPTGGQQLRYEDLRGLAKELAQMIEHHCPNSREKSLAITSLQQTIMWANAAIAINENEDETAQPAVQPYPSRSNE